MLTQHIYGLGSPQDRCWVSNMQLPALAAKAGSVNTMQQ